MLETAAGCEMIIGDQGSKLTKRHRCTEFYGGL